MSSAVPSRATSAVVMGADGRERGSTTTTTSTSTSTTTSSTSHACREPLCRLPLRRTPVGGHCRGERSSPSRPATSGQIHSSDSDHHCPCAATHRTARGVSRSRSRKHEDVGKGIVGAVTSHVGRIAGRDVVIARALGSMRRGAITHADGIRLAEAADQARELGIPFVFHVASSGSDINDGVAALHGWGKAAAALSRCSGQVPTIAAATGPVVSGPALMLGLCDLVIMTSEAVAFVSGPQMVEEFTGIRVGLSQLGGTAAHATTSGLCAIESDDVDGAVAELLEYLPSNTDEVPPRIDIGDSPLRSTPELRDVIPERKAASYDVRDVIKAVSDDGDITELHPRWAGQIVTAFGYLGGLAVGFVANQPQHPRRHPRHRRLTEGRPLRPPVRLASTSRSSAWSTRPAFSRARTSSGGG